MATLLRKSKREIESTIHGTSMEPTIPDGARIRIAPCDAGDFRVGQVAACIYDGLLFAHRIVYCGSKGRARDFVLTQGDGWLLCDRPVRKDAILGVVDEVQIDGVWRAPGAPPALGLLRRAFVGVQLRLIEACLSIHHQLARGVSRVLLTLGAIARELERRRRRGPA